MVNLRVKIALHVEEYQSNSQMWVFERDLTQRDIYGKSSKKKNKKTVTADFKDRCPSCQVPFHVVAKHLQSQHVLNCLDTTATLQEECSDGGNCRSENLKHFKQYRHDQLARLHSEINFTSGHGWAETSSAVNGDEPVWSGHTTGYRLVRRLHSCSDEATASVRVPKANDDLAIATSSCIIIDGDSLPSSSVRPEQTDETTHSSVTSQTTLNGGNGSLFEASLPEELLSEFATDFDASSTVDVSHFGSAKSSESSLTPDGSKVSRACVNVGNIATPKKATQQARNNKRSPKSSVLPSNQMTIRSFFSSSSASKLDSSPSSSNHVGLSCGETNERTSTTVPAPASVQVSSSVNAVTDSFSSTVHNRPGASWSRIDLTVPDKDSSTVVGNSSSAVDAFPEASTSASNRQCPFYKRIPGTTFVVDAFSYGTIPGCTAYFLSHFHYDHYGGLRRTFSHRIYCSRITANLVQLKIKVSPSCIQTLPIGVPQIIEGVEVTLLDANHCPGSVMFLYKLKSGLTYLHTGDFRADPAMQQYPSLQSVKIDQLFLDTTYCDPSYSFPVQSAVIDFAVKTAVDFIRTHPKALIAVGTYTIGKERIFTAIAEKFDCKIYATQAKKSILDCLEDDRISRRLTLVKTDARVHVVFMNQLNIEDLTEYLDRLQPQFDHVLAFEPTGWTHSKKTPSIENIRPRISNSRVTLYGVPYSEHSSYEELKQFVQFAKPRKIIPTVNNGNARSRQQMSELFNAWMTAPMETKPVSRQRAVIDWFKQSFWR